MANKGRIELKARAQQVLAHFSRSIAAYGAQYEPGIGSEANRLLQDILATQKANVRGTAEEYAKKSSVFSPAFFNAFDEAADREARRIKSELDLWEAQMKQRHEKPSTSSNVVTVSGNFNVVQTATIGSSARLIIDADSRQALSDGLTALRGALSGADDLDPVQRTELAQVIDDCEQEVTRETPNQSRLMGALQAIATTVQTTASLQPAWEVVRRAMQLMGIL
jgi:hypothetical protein